jgi:hypothetical protein
MTFIAVDGALQHRMTMRMPISNLSFVGIINHQSSITNHHFLIVELSVGCTKLDDLYIIALYYTALDFIVLRNLIIANNENGKPFPLHLSSPGTMRDRIFHQYQVQVSHRPEASQSSSNCNSDEG